MSFWRFGLVAALAHAQCVTKQLISAGDGVTFPKSGDTVSMHYTGTLATTGTKFDSSKDRGKEFSTQIGVGQVIQGWDQGVPQMSLGEHAILRISAACGYGARGSPPDIPANADLVFDVELNGLNGRRAGASAAPAVASFGASIAAAPASPVAKAVAPPASALPRCIKSSCGHAISFDGTGASRPLCLCNPLCSEWAKTPGILPCCPGIQEVCLDPYRSPSPGPASAPLTTSSLPPASLPSSLPASASFSSSASFPASFSASASSASFPASPASFPASSTSSNFASSLNAMPLPSASGISASASLAVAPLGLPTCRPNSCGKGMASGVNSLTAICACDVSCLASGSSLPCCQSFKEVCQSGLTVSVPVAQPQTFTQTQSAPQSQVTGSQSLVAPQSSAAKSAASAAASAGSAAASCALGKTDWAEQEVCDKKRWAIQNGKCKKVCPTVDTKAGIKYYPTGTPGKDACSAALAACRF